MAIVKRIDSSIFPNTSLTIDYGYGNTSYSLVVRGINKRIEQKDGSYLSCIFDLINAIGIPHVSLSDYKDLTDNAHRKIFSLIKLYYPTSFTYEIFRGKQYDYYEGLPSKLTLDVEARWPWSISSYQGYSQTYQVKSVHFSSKVTRQFMCSIESNITDISGKTISLGDNITIDHIHRYMKFIVAAYIHEMKFFGTLEGRIFNGGGIDDIEKIVRDGSLIVDM